MFDHTRLHGVGHCADDFVLLSSLFVVKVSVMTVKVNLRQV